MIISDDYRFLFVANLKTASTSLHIALRSVATLYLDETGTGKHVTLGDTYAEYGAARIDSLFKWAVIREPAAYLWSLYQFHKNPAFAGKPHSTAEKTFEEFYLGDTHGWMRVSQSSRLADLHGEYALDFLITMDRLAEGFAYVKFRLGLPNILLPLTNTTELGPPEIPEHLHQRIQEDYRDDYICIERYGNRERTADGFHRILQPVDATAPGAR